MILFDLLKQLLKSAVNDTDFIKKNTILQDTATKAELLSRIDLFQRDYPVVKKATDMIASGTDSPTGSVSVDILNRKISIAATTTGTGTFVSVTHPPLKLFGWLLSSDSTVLASELEVQYRTSSTDSWKKLLQIDHVDNVTTLQFRINIPVGLGSPKELKSLIILAEQI